MVVQENWRWCRKCQGLFYGGNPQNACPAGGQHDRGPSGNYVLIDNTPSAIGQHEWRWCRKCQGLFYGGNPQNACPAGGQHDGTQSGNYTLFNNDPAAFGQPDWRWCRNCQGLFYGKPAVTQGACPAVLEFGPHDGTQSGEYKLMHYKD